MSAGGSWAAVVLAAGASRRMGQPKALLEWEGGTILGRLVSAYLEQTARVIVVLGHDAETIAAGVPELLRAVVVLNPRPARGQASSLACGLRAVPDSAPWIWFTPVDAPGVRAETLQRLQRAAAQAGPAVLLVAPEWRARRGHPVALRRQLLPEFLNLGPDQTARTVLDRHRGSTLLVPVDDEAVRRDLDRPADYEASRPGVRP